MIKINFNTETYCCPFCGHDQAYSESIGSVLVGSCRDVYDGQIPQEDGPSSLKVVWLTCANTECRKTCITSFNRFDDSQHDVYPVVTFAHYPDYIPVAIRADYEEACSIVDRSPKAAATMFRRCLQGMIRDFHGIAKARLIDEIEELKDVVSAAQWRAIDAIRKIGNIGAHMEKDVNQIIDVDVTEANALRGMIELLMDKWYIARHDEEELCSALTEIASKKCK